MNFTCVEIENATGRILACSNVPWDIVPIFDPMVPEGTTLKWLDGGVPMPNLREEYFDFSEQVFKRHAAMPVTVDKTDIIADGEDFATIADIPQAALVFVDGERLPVSDGTLELVSSMPATYRVRIECWPFADFETEIVAT